MADDAAEIERLRKAIHDNNRSTIVRIAEATEARMKAEARVAELEVALRARPVGPKWRHIKRGSIYTEIWRGKVQTDTPLTDYAEVVVYQADDGSIWVRPVSEFEDGRFAALTPNTAQEDHPHDR